MGKYAGLRLIITAGPRVGKTNCVLTSACSAFHGRRNKSTSRSTKPGAASSSTKSSIYIADLPRHNVDANGRFASPLPPLHGFGQPFTVPNLEAQAKDEIPQSSVSSTAGLSVFSGVAKPSTEPFPNEESDYLAAVAQGVIPDSALAKQVFQNWRRFPDCIILTRVGKFYESYFTPAIQLASLLSLRLAHKRYVSGVYPFAGFPVPQLDKYLKILVQDLGRSVVLVEEYPDDAANASGENISRRIGRIVTPGTLLDESWVRGDESRYLLALAIGHNPHIPSGSEGSVFAIPVSLAYTDVSTGEFFTKGISSLALEDELARIAPKEIVLDQQVSDSWTIGRGSDASLPSEIIRVLLESCGAHLSFATGTLVAGIGTSDQDLERQAISLLRQHLAFTLRDSSPDLATPDRQRESEHMHIDAATLHALEIRHALRADGPDALSPSPIFPNDAFAEGMHSVPLTSRGTLLSVLRRTVTPSGTRLLTRTLTSPSTNISQINSRLDLVETLLKNSELRRELRELVKAQVDVMRVIQRFRARQGDGRDLAEVGRWIRGIENIAVTMTGRNMDRPSAQDGKTLALRKFTGLLRPLSQLAESIENAVDEKVLGHSGIHSGGQVGNEDAYADGISADLSEGSADPKHGKLGTMSLMETRMEQRERERDEKENIWWIKPNYSVTIQQRHENLNTLKRAKEQMQRILRRKYDVATLVLTKGMRYGYHAYVTKKAEGSVLESSRKFVLAATAKGGKAFIHGPWSALGVQIESAAEAISIAQRSAFEDLRLKVIGYADDIKVNSDALSELDMSLGFAQAAQDLKLTRPKLDKSIDLEILNGRHPAVEAGLLASARMFTPNSIRLQPPTSLLHVITGPNQGGKSTILRQSALIAILAQSGSFVPADEARIGVVDRVFSRIGSRDDLFRDRSTFMLEMVETAAILRQATRRSLVIMDEIGRGTTLQAGVSIAYATLDHLLKHNRCRTLFATHYHELGAMLGYDPVTKSAQRDGVEFWCTDIEEDDTTFSYSYRLQRGLNHESHAIKAAKLASMPDEFLRVAEDTLAKLQDAACVTKGENRTGRST